MNLSQIKLELSKLIAAFSEIKTDRAILTYPEETELYVGLDVYVLNEEGEYTPAEDGEYKLEDGRILIIESGRITEIKEAVEETFEEETPAVEEIKEEGEPDAIEGLRKEVNELFSVVDTLIKEVSELKSKVTESSETIEKMSKMSAAMSAVEEIKAPVNTKTGNTKLDEKLNKMFNNGN